MENSKLRFSLACLHVAAAIGCSELTVNTTPPEEGAGDPAGGIESDPNHPTGNTAVILGTDFIVGTLSLLGIDPPRTVTSNIQTAHSDAIVRAFGNKIYVVNRLGADNIEVIDPAADFAVTLQFSVGQGTNPQQIVATGASRGYVSLYQPEDNRSEEMQVDDILVVNLVNGAILKTIDLTPYAADDGTPLPRASAMVVIGDRLFVALQDLPGGFLGPDQQGKIAVIDTTTDTVVTVIELAGRNPVSMDYSPETGMIYVALADYFDISSSFGGIEVVDPEEGLSRGIFIDDLLLGGASGDIETGGVKGCITVGYFDEAFNFLTKVVSFDLDPEGTPALTTLYESQGYVNDIAIDQNGNLLVGDMNPTVNGTVFVDPVTGEQIDGPITTGSAPYSITFVDW